MASYAPLTGERSACRGTTKTRVVGRVTPAIIHDINEVVSRAAILSKELNCAIEPGFEVFVANGKTRRK